MLAIIKTGGKQYLVSAGEKIKIEKIDAEPGKEISLGEVLLVADGGEIEIGAPLVDGAEVKAKVLRQDKGVKKIVFKYKPKKRIKTKKGHRQMFTEVEILSIGKKTAKKAAKPKAEK